MKLKARRYALYDYAVVYPGLPEADFALFVAREDAEAFVTLMKLTDSREYKIVDVEH